MSFINFLLKNILDKIIEVLIEYLKTYDHEYNPKIKNNGLDINA